MKFDNKRFLILLAAISLLAFAGCSDGDDDSPVDPDPGTTTTYATVDFVFDDTRAQIYTTASGLACKGTFTYDANEDLLAYDAASSGPFVMLFDDGAVADGGHEPAGATADDHIWGAQVRMETPDEPVTLEFDVITGSVDGSDGEWILGHAMQNLTIVSGETGAVTAPTVTDWYTPADGYVLIEFAIDDTAGQTATTATQMAWKGSFGYDAATRILTYDGSWQGPFPYVWDDGPFSAGGHEGANSVAGDHIWSVAVWMANDQQRTLEYGAVSGYVEGGNGTWIWPGDNGYVAIPAGVTGPITAPGLVLN